MNTTPDITIARVYDDPASDDRTRILVDRVWPRGIAKEDLDHDDWNKEVAPSDDLRKWFGHDPDRWAEFRNRYMHELAGNADAVERCLKCCRKGPVTLLYAAKDREHNQAVVLRDYLSQRMKSTTT
ncbi:DUF488 domain-containing protein [Roseovarius pelagicus]|uniref:DUF488 domain-containing protein n=1 Tax=Roseovarius pelagicus TaxID=2980108 RepID=A0ABY6DAD1_9RHOB|nr:DUF488 domain-containing protein [Roseovarius pelagicus]UXX83096.1 DUF488 domain-containing protein [Roseovarius pelagicus]